MKIYNTNTNAITITRRSRLQRVRSNRLILIEKIAKLNGEQTQTFKAATKRHSLSRWYCTPMVRKLPVRMMSVRDVCWFIVTISFTWTCRATGFCLGTTVIHHIHCREYTVSNHGLLCVCYADDTQLYFHFKQDKIPVAKAMLEECIQQIHTWLSSNTLRLNFDKLEVMSARRMGTFEQPLLCMNNQQSRHLVWCMTLEHNYVLTRPFKIRWTL